MEPDPYGIPEGMFGPLDPELPALIGRIAMLSALLETRVDSLASSLSRALQSETAGRNPTDNIGACRKTLAAIEADPARAAFAARTAKLLDEIESALKARNAVIHRVWPKAGLAGWAGWKPIRKKKGDRDDREWTDWKSFSRAELVADVSRLVRLISEMGDVLAETG